ncbi:MAG TPA: tRNA (adenosine(37)-N6)-dimethylallyltransferase MiaA [Rhodospirillaceae bacterium]|nr:tRNA (adenosine(37)-N6)-dimethylallyltransferase MiaA [Rhodospirillaceae bacterium]
MKTVHIITGPTASGKSARAYALAESHHGVVINADAMQCYAPLPILSAQPTVDEQKEIPHRMYGFLNPLEKLNAARWAELARAEIENAFADGLQPILCGGTGLYLKALTEGMAVVPDIDPSVRMNLQTRLTAEGLPALYAELQKIDAELAARLKPNDTQRILRGLEVFIGTNRKLSEWQQAEHLCPPEYEFKWEIILPEREVLYDKINHRTHAMIAGGVLDEVRGVEIPEASTAWKTHGYREFRSHLRGEISLDEAITQTQQVTRNYAKRQFTWWRNQSLR